MPDPTLNTPNMAYPLPSTKADEQSTRYENLKIKYPQLTEADLTGGRAYILGKISQKLGLTVDYIEGVIIGTIT